MPSLPTVRELFPDLFGASSYPVPSQAFVQRVHQSSPDYLTDGATPPSNFSLPVSLPTSRAPSPQWSSTTHTDDDRLSTATSHRCHQSAPVTILSQWDKSSHTQYIHASRSHTPLHRGKHVPPRRYSCEECSAKFARPCELKSHMNKHTGERPYSCELCSGRFSTSSNVNRHMRTVHAPGGVSRGRQPSHSSITSLSSGLLLFASSRRQGSASLAY